MGRAQVTFHEFSEADVAPYTNTHFNRQEVGNLKSGFNYVRFILAKAPSRYPVAWMDSDMIVQNDIVEFMDKVLPKEGSCSFSSQYQRSSLPQPFKRSK